MSNDAQELSLGRSGVTDALATFTVPYLQRLYRVFDGDLLLPLVLGEIAQHNLARAENASDSVAHRFSDDARRKRYMRPCNTLGLSALTGVPRETVRRKVDLLVRAGLVDRNERGHLSVTRLADERFASIERETVASLVTAADRVRALGSGGR